MQVTITRADRRLIVDLLTSLIDGEVVGGISVERIRSITPGELLKLLKKDKKEAGTFLLAQRTLKRLR